MHRLARAQGYAISVPASTHPWSFRVIGNSHKHEILPSANPHTDTDTIRIARQGNKLIQCRLTSTFHLDVGVKVPQIKASLPRPTSGCCNPRECPVWHDIRTAAVKPRKRLEKRSREYTRSCEVAATTHPDVTPRIPHEASCSVIPNSTVAYRTLPGQQIISMMAQSVQTKAP